jgi:hypothetical protein
MSASKVNSDLSAPQDFAYGAAYSDVNSALDHTTRPPRGFRVGGAGDVYLVMNEGEAERLFLKDALAGECRAIQFYELGSSTTATHITVLY